MRNIDADKLIDNIKAVCEMADDKESDKWCKWFIEVINAEVNRQNNLVY